MSNKIEGTIFRIGTNERLSNVSVHVFEIGKNDKPIKDDIAMNTTMGLIRATDLNLSSGKSKLIF